QNIAYATVHNDEQTPHMHLGVVPMRDGKLQGKNVFNRQELLWLQDKFPEHMKKQGFELKRGERGSDRKHIETAKFKKQTLEKEIDFLEKNLAVKKDEWTAYSDKVKSDLEVPAKRHMKNVEVLTGEKSMFGLGKEIMKTEKKPTKNVVISERDYKKLVNAARDNDKLKQHVRNLMSTDMEGEYKNENIDNAKKKKKVSKEHEQIKEKYIGLVERYNENVNDYNELLEENKSLKSKISDLKRDVSLIYESTKEFLKERTDGLKAFKNVFKRFVDKIKDKTAQFQEKHDLEPKKNEFELTHNREVKKERSRDQGMSL